MESEKKKIEKETAQAFLSLYNPKYGTHFKVSELSEAPDVVCKDAESGDILFLEVTLLENLKGNVAHELGRGNPPISPTTKTTVIDFFKDVVPCFRKQLEKKLLSSYGEKTALVLRQVSILWEPMEWEWIKPYFQAEILKGKESQFGAGIWVICTDNTTWPASETLFCISPPVSSGATKED